MKSSLKLSCRVQQQIANDNRARRYLANFCLLMLGCLGTIAALAFLSAVSAP